MFYSVKLKPKKNPYAYVCYCFTFLILNSKRNLVIENGKMELQLGFLEAHLVRSYFIGAIELNDFKKKLYSYLIKNK